MVNNKKYWEDRSKEYKSDIKGVLFRNMPLVVNEYIHNWTTKQILQSLPKSKKIKVLDLGSGYGRLSEEILLYNKYAKTTGIDIASGYVKMYNSKLKPRGKSYTGDIKKLPFKDSSFDFVFSVTTLMYVISEKDQNKAVSEIFRVLKKNGEFVIIEPNPQGQLIATLGRRSKNSTSYSPQGMIDLIESNGGRVVALTGVPFFTFSLLPMFLLSKINHSLVRVSLIIVSYLDRLELPKSVPSLYNSYLGKKA